MRRLRLSGRIALLLAGLLSCAVMVAGPGCAPSGVTQTDYAVRVGSIDVGSELVRVEKNGGRIVYTESSKRPYRVFETNISRTLAVSSGNTGPIQYDSSERVPGASFSDFFKRSANSYESLNDKLQTFSYTGPVRFKGNIYPLETDSAALTQALLDRFIASGVRTAVTTVIIPSEGGLIRGVRLSNSGAGQVDVSIGGIGDFRLKYEKPAGTLVEITPVGNSTRRLPVIARGGADLPESKAYRPPERGYSVNEVRVPTRDRRELAGSLYIPSGKAPYRSVVLVTDVGPYDRTGAGMLSQIADGLARAGLAVLVCDKRGVPHSGGSYATYTLDSAVADLESQVDFLALRDDMNPNAVAVVGIGEGGVAASTAAVEDPYIASCVLMASPAVRMYPDLARLEVEGAETRGEISAGEAQYEMALIDENVALTEQAQADTISLAGHNLFLGWMRSHARHDPAATFTAVPTPVLVVQGSADKVVPADQAGQLMALLAARPRGGQELALFDGLGHEFGPMIGEAASRPYRSHARMDPRVLEKITTWLGEKLNAL